MCRIKNYYQAAITVLLITALVTPPAWPWGGMGHRIVARIAQERLTPEALAAIHDLLGPEISLVDLATWADEQKAIPDTDPWHYVNVPISEVGYDPKYCPSRGCVVSKINDFRTILQDPKTGKEEKQQALKFLIHLITDIHQPLHVGDTGSRGGNQIQVRFYGQGSNLHRVWDSQIIEHYSNDENEWIRELTDGLVELENAGAWSRVAPEEWATESLHWAKRAYCLPNEKTVMKSGTKLPDTYTYMVAVEIIKIRLAMAGYRVAWMLNDIFR